MFASCYNTVIVNLLGGSGSEGNSTREQHSMALQRILPQSIFSAHRNRISDNASSTEDDMDISGWIYALIFPIFRHFASLYLKYVRVYVFITICPLYFCIINSCCFWLIILFYFSLFFESLVFFYKTAFIALSLLLFYLNEHQLNGKQLTKPFKTLNIYMRDAFLLNYNWN